MRSLLYAEFSIIVRSHDSACGGPRLNIMDSNIGTVCAAIIPYGDEPTVNDSQESSARSLPFNNGDLVKLFLSGLGEVGVGSIVDVRPVGQWLGMSIPVEPWVFVLLRPHSFSVTSHDFQLNPRQRGFRTLADVLD